MLSGTDTPKVWSMLSFVYLYISTNSLLNEYGIVQNSKYKKLFAVRYSYKH